MKVNAYGVEHQGSHVLSNCWSALIMVMLISDPPQSNNTPLQTYPLADPPLFNTYILN